jgi:hypothetical protein
MIDRLNNPLLRLEGPIEDWGMHVSIMVVKRPGLVVETNIASIYNISAREAYWRAVRFARLHRRRHWEPWRSIHISIFRNGRFYHIVSV